MRKSEKIDQLMKEVEEDLRISDNLAVELNKTVKLHNKYFKMLLMTKEQLQEENHRLNYTVKHRSDYYLGRARPEEYQKHPFHHKVLKSELSQYLSADSACQEHEKKIQELENIATFLENLIKNHINYRDTKIKTTLEYLKFSQGQI